MVMLSFWLEHSRGHCAQTQAVSSLNNCRSAKWRSNKLPHLEWQECERRKGGIVFRDILDCQRGKRALQLHITGCFVWFRLERFHIEGGMGYRKAQMIETLKREIERSTWITYPKGAMLQTLWDTRYLLDPLRPWSNSSGWHVVGIKRKSEKDQSFDWLRVGSEHYDECRSCSNCWWTANEEEKEVRTSTMVLCIGGPSNHDTDSSPHCQTDSKLRTRECLSIGDLSVIVGSFRSCWSSISSLLDAFALSLLVAFVLLSMLSTALFCRSSFSVHLVNPLPLVFRDHRCSSDHCHDHSSLRLYGSAFLHSLSLRSSSFEQWFHLHHRKDHLFSLKPTFSSSTSSFDWALSWLCSFSSCHGRAFSLTPIARRLRKKRHILEPHFSSGLSNSTLC